jgi:hypothetical protein
MALLTKPSGQRLLASSIAEAISYNRRSKEAGLIVSSRAERIAFTVFCVATSVVAVHRAWSGRQTAKTDASEIRNAYFDGRLVSFQLAPVPPGVRTKKVGPWQFGARVLYPTPRDRRQNLYVVAPGSEHRVPGYEAYDHNDIINYLPASDSPEEWDVYWGVVLDPALKQEFRGENELLLATQNEFHPGKDFRFNDIPAAAFLRDIVKVGSMDALKKYRRPSGNLPQVLIVPADFAVRASAHEMESQPQAAGQ